MMIHELTATTGRYKNRKRVGRGIGSGHGKTCGRGHKGAGSRSGSGGAIRASREGGQMPFFRRIPKRGFSNALFRKHFSVVNVKVLEERLENGTEVNADILAKFGLIDDASLPLKILGEGTLTKKFSVTAAAYSKLAAEKIVAAGGTATVAGA
ncbi:MAG: 50S ribosomal protein L15 [Phycisphaeraceae bacterium]|nr:50S ribosomal protein L15 [Phycisphaeraceae bacterium]